MHDALQLPWWYCYAPCVLHGRHCTRHPAAGTAQSNVVHALLGADSSLTHYVDVLPVACVQLLPGQLLQNAACSAGACSCTLQTCSRPSKQQVVSLSSPTQAASEWPLQHVRGAHCAFCLASTTCLSNTTNRGQQSRHCIWKQRLTRWPSCSALSRSGKQGEPCWRRSSCFSSCTFLSCSEVASHAEAAIWLCACRGQAARHLCCSTGCGYCGAGVW